MRIILILSLIIIAGCGKPYAPIAEPEQGQSPGGSGNNPQPQPDLSFESILNFCSKLPFDGMAVPKELSVVEINTFALALNITSTFEGKENWRNITNNFDGQGLSMGLLNQTLGTESLQPLLLEMYQGHKQVMKNQFSNSNFSSIEKMILDWKKDVGIKNFRASEDLFPIYEGSLSPLDFSNSKMDTIVFSNASSKSVDWAVKNIYTDSAGRRFKADWKSQLQSLCGTSEYRSIQFEAARFLHEKAKKYFEEFELKELRSYLFLFDVMVQNGGFYQRNLTEYRDFIKKNPRSNETQKLNFLLQSRLVQVRDQFKEDVRARKQSLIDGQGRVHGSQRNYEREFCYSSVSLI